MKHLAMWRSRGGKWSAVLTEDGGDFTLTEFKDSVRVGSSFRPGDHFRTSPPHAETAENVRRAAAAWAAQQVANGFDVRMARVAVDRAALVALGLGASEPEDPQCAGAAP